MNVVGQLLLVCIGCLFCYASGREDGLGHLAVGNALFFIGSILCTGSILWSHWRNNDERDHGGRELH